MTVVPSQQPEPTVRRRLLLAKQLYEHALDHSQSPGALDKMIAVHNFHNAIEIVVRCIMLHYEIRAEREINIDFESMLNEVDKHPLLRQEGKRVPYRQALRNLGLNRNMVQHHAYEPETAIMEEWRVFTKKFLTKACDVYFGVPFESLSPVEFVTDSHLRKLLSRARECISNGRWAPAACLAKLAVRYASAAVYAQLPSEGLDSASFAPSALSGGGGAELRGVMEDIYRRIAATEGYAALLATGVPLSDYRRYHSIGPFLTFAITGTVWFDGGQDVTSEDTCWLCAFAERTIVHWQTLQLSPGVLKELESGCDEFLRGQF